MKNPLLFSELKNSLKFLAQHAESQGMGGMGMLQMTILKVWVLSLYLTLAVGCGQGSLLDNANANDNSRRSAVSNSNPEDTKADQPQSMAGAYLTCDDYETIVSPQGKVMSTRCKVLDKTDKRVPLSSFPKRSWGVSDQTGTAVSQDAVQVTERKNDPDFDAEVIVSLTDMAATPVVDFWFDQTKPDTKIRARITIKASPDVILRVLDQIRGTWDVRRGCADEDLPMTNIGKLELIVTEAGDGGLPLVKGMVPANASLVDKTRTPVATVTGGTVIFEGRVHYNALPAYIELTVTPNAVVQKPDPEHKPRLKVKGDTQDISKMLSISKLEMELKEKVGVLWQGTRTTQWELSKPSASLTE